MKLFQNLFTPKWKNKNPEIRKQALVELDREQNQSVFCEIANSDEISELRQIALKRINDLNTLMQVACNNTDTKARELAIKITSQILAGVSEHRNHIETDEQTRLGIIQALDDQKILEFVAKNGNSSAIRQAAIQKISRESLMGDLAITDPDIEIRKLVAEKLQQKSTLERVFKASKNKDKQISKIVKDKLDHIIAEEARPRQILAKQKMICQTLEQLGKKGLWERDKIQFDQLTTQWRELTNEPTPDLQTRFDAAVKQFETAYESYLTRNEERLKQEAGLAPLKHEKQSLLMQFHQLLDKFNEHKFSGESNNIKQTYEELEKKWHELEQLPKEIEQDFNNQYQDVAKKIKSHIQDISSALKANSKLQAIHSEIRQMLKHSSQLKQSRIKTLEDKLDKVTLNDIKLTETKQEILGLIKQAKKVVNENTEKAKNLYSTTEEMLKKLDKHLDKGETKPANDVQKKIQSNIKQLENLGHDKLAELKRQISDYSHRLYELNKWRSWANTPKKERLVEEVEALIGSDLDPKEIAFLVSKARKDWQKLGPSERNSSQELWERFNKACDSAYEPCKSVFKEEAKVRQENYEKRIAFLENLEAFINEADWDNVDWVKVENLFQQSRAEWQNLGPIDKNKRKSLNTRFNKAHNALKSHLNTEWSNNQKAKQEIIDKSQALIELEDLNTAIIEAKNLQQQWKTAGRVQRRIEREMWSKFRENCDKIFARRDKLKQQKQEDEKQTVEQKESLCQELESLCNAPIADIEKNENTIHSIQAKIKTLPSVDAKLEKDINNRIIQALHIFDIKKDAANRKKQVESLAKLHNKVELIQHLEESLEKSHSIDWDSATQKFNSFSNEENSSWDEALNRRFEVLKSAMQNEKFSDLAKNNLSDAKKIIIQLEIIAEVETPPEDSAERLKIQTERLNDKLKNHAEQSRWEAFISTETNWLLTGPIPSEELNALKNRHKKIVDALKQQFTEELDEY